VFGFCDIRRFTDSTEVLQEEVMEFVNSIAHIVHAAVAVRGGAANKNIGDAFLLVWKLPRGIRSRELATLSAAAAAQGQAAVAGDNGASSSWGGGGREGGPTFPSAPGGAAAVGSSDGGGSGLIPAGGGPLSAAMLDWPGLQSAGEDGQDTTSSGASTPHAACGFQPHMQQRGGGVTSVGGGSPLSTPSPARSPLRLSGVGPGALGLGPGSASIFGGGSGVAAAPEALQQALSQELRAPSATSSSAHGTQQQRRSGGGFFFGRRLAASSSKPQQHVSIADGSELIQASGGSGSGAAHRQQPSSDLDRQLSQLAVQRAHSLAHALSMPRGPSPTTAAAPPAAVIPHLGSFSRGHQGSEVSLAGGMDCGAVRSGRSSSPSTIATTAAAAHAASLRRAVTIIKTVRHIGLSAATKGAIVNSIADSALASFVVIQTALAHSTRLKRYSRREDLNARMPGFQVQMGFGLHVGWAIEGPIGSEYKVDASYLSPNVNMASRLEAATKQYGVPLLLSRDFVDCLSPAVRSRVRQVDCVTVKGSTQPVGLFTYDLDAAAAAEVAEALLSGRGWPPVGAAAFEQKAADSSATGQHHQRPPHHHVSVHLPPLRPSVMERATHLADMLVASPPLADGGGGDHHHHQQQVGASSSSTHQAAGAGPLPYAAARARASIVKMEPPRHSAAAVSGSRQHTAGAALSSSAAGSGTQGASPSISKTKSKKHHQQGAVEEEECEQGGEAADLLIGARVGGGGVVARGMNGVEDDWVCNPLVTDTWGLDWGFKEAWDSAVAVS